MNGDWTLPLPMVLGHEAAGVVEEVGRRRRQREAGRSRHLLVPSAVRPLPLLLDRALDSLRRPSERALDDARRHVPAQAGRAGHLLRWRASGRSRNRSCAPPRCWCRSARRCRGRRRRLMGCCVPTGVGAVTRCAEVEAGASVVVIGCGGVGLNVVQGARLAGARLIIACDLLDNKLQYARGVRRHTHGERREPERGRHGARPHRRPRRRLRLRRDRGRGDDAADLDAIRPGGTAVIVRHGGA